MMSIRCALTAALLAAILTPGVTSHAATSLELYGTFHAMGIIVTFAASDDPEQNAVATVTYRRGSEAFAAGLPLVRTGQTTFVGSLFWLDPSLPYDVRVSFVDPGGLLDGQMISGSAPTRTEITIPPAANSWYAGPSGIGSTCSIGLPCTPQTAINLAQAGDEVVLRGGIYFVGDLSFPRSGSAGSPIVVRAYAGETPILDGSDTQNFVWAPQGGGVYNTTVNVGDPHLVAANGERLYPYGSLADLQNLVWGIPGFYASGPSVSVRLEGDANPNSATMIVSRENRAMYIDQDSIYLDGLGFRYFGQGSWAKAVYFYNASDNLVRNSTFLMCDLGIGLKYASHRNVIEANTFSDTIFNWPWDAVKNGASLESGGVRMYDPMSGRGTVIRRNTFFDDFDGFGVCPASDTGATCETDVYNNLAYDLGDDAVETDGYCSNVRIWGNTFHDLLIGISLAPVYTGPVYAVRNLIYETGKGDNQYSGSCFKLNSGYAQSGPMFLYHNTCDAGADGLDAFDIRSPGTWTGLTTRNNIWSATRFALSNENPSQAADLDWDVLYTTMTDELAWWQGYGHLRNLADLQNTTGQEDNGINVDPMFTTGSYNLEINSPLVDAALLIPGINHDFEGAGPEFGAFESLESIFSDGFESSDTSYWSATNP